MENILSALKSIDVAKLTRADWISVGMALKEEGYPCSVWDDLSKNDVRYHTGECERIWKSFRGNPAPVTGGTIIGEGTSTSVTPAGSGTTTAGAAIAIDRIRIIPKKD